jgi:hypothetical protein
MAALESPVAVVVFVARPATVLWQSSSLEGYRSRRPVELGVCALGLGRSCHRREEPRQNWIGSSGASGASSAERSWFSCAFLICACWASMPSTRF